jgi:hypothetical protein
MSAGHRKSYEPIQIALISPADVESEREQASKVVESLNRSMAMQFGFVILLKRWEDIHPALHAFGPQGHIDDQLSIPDCDLAVAILWGRLGTPTASGQTGTEHELRAAYDAWRRHHRPQLMLYFNKAAVSISSPEDARQTAAVQELRKEFQDKALFREYNGASTFAEEFRSHLTKFIADRVNARSKTVCVIPCFPSSYPSPIRAEGMAELVGEIALQLPFTLLTAPIPCAVTAVLNTAIANTVLDEGLLADVFLTCRRKKSGKNSSYQGRLLTDNRVNFNGVTLEPPGPDPDDTQDYRIEGLRVNASQLGFSGLRETTVQAWIQVDSPSDPPIQVLNPTVTVGIVKSYPVPFAVIPTDHGDEFSIKSGVNADFALGRPGSIPEPSLRLRLAENYAGDFTSAAEEGRYRHDRGENKRPTGLRFLVAFTGVPSGMDLYVTTRDISSDSRSEVSARLIAADSFGAGAARPVDPDLVFPGNFHLSRLTVLDGECHATWEWIRSRSSLVYPFPRWAEFGVVLAARPESASPGTAMAQFSFAPVGFEAITGIRQSRADSTSPVPRFAKVRTPVRAFTIR